MIRILAYAKINLSLNVLRRREDGFHEIDSLIQTIDLADEITVRPTDAPLTVTNNLGIAPQEDLAWRAARLVLDRKDVRSGMRITVHKKIPTGAGLGGGSSDAAAVLWVVDHLTPPVLPHRHLFDLAAQLGSDVPLFLHGGLLRATGRGEAITPVFPRRREQFVLIVPPMHCITASVYREMRTRIVPDRRSAQQPHLGENDLYAAAVFLYPELTPYAHAIGKLGAEYAGMSGSGSTFYAAFKDETAATSVCAKVEKEFPEARVYLARGTSTGFLAKGEE
ncbi:MAG: 4-(cytidine 5'-diphospho)-2-C-methyl-D-erythritol kinase [Candidatus Bipolaricaulota bacterium]|nr:4-(cytidine 5'-diphospho)-2-C-methyl-D-erythritol kinase [Candidatus Bipolaricaulota bacterium]